MIPNRLLQFNIIPNVDFEVFARSKDSTSIQIVFIEQMLNVKQTMILSWGSTDFFWRKISKPQQLFHRQDIKNAELFKYILSLKDAGAPHNIKWLTKANVKSSTKNYLPLFLIGKYHFIEYLKEIQLLKSEFINACRQSKLLLSSLKRNIT